MLFCCEVSRQCGCARIVRVSHCLPPDLPSPDSPVTFLGRRSLCDAAHLDIGDLNGPLVVSNVKAPSS